jgi:lysozyme family protein
MTNFEKAVQIVLAHEGSRYTDNPNDAGGPTKFGITLPDWLEFYGSDGQASDIQGLTVETATAIYKKLYWDAMNLDLISDFNVALCLFDQGVLQGKGVAIHKIQELVGINSDGVIGPMTANAINKEPGQKLAFRFIRADLHRYNKIVAGRLSQIEFLDGWDDRLFSLLDYIFFGDAS